MLNYLFRNQGEAQMLSIQIKYKVDDQQYNQLPWFQFEF